MRFSVQDYMDFKSGKIVCPHPILTDSLIDESEFGKRYQCFLCGERFDNKEIMQIDSETRYIISMSRTLTPLKYSRIKSLINDNIVFSNRNHPKMDIIRLLKEYEDKLAKNNPSSMGHTRVKRK